MGYFVKCQTPKWAYQILKILKSYWSLMCSPKEKKPFSSRLSQHLKYLNASLTSVYFAITLGCQSQPLFSSFLPLCMATPVFPQIIFSPSHSPKPSRHNSIEGSRKKKEDQDKCNIEGGGEVIDPRGHISFSIFIDGFLNRTQRLTTKLKWRYFCI